MLFRSVPDLRHTLKQSTLPPNFLRATLSTLDFISKNVAAYLLQSYEVQPPPSHLSPDGVVSDYKFVTFCDHKSTRHFSDIAKFVEAVPSTPNTDHGQVLFMRGHPSSEWLATIGAKYQVEPDFFQRHLNFRLQAPNHFSPPSLPSSSESMVRLRIPTIGVVRAGRDQTQDRKSVV